MSEPRRSPSGNGPTLLALFGLLFAAAGLIALTGLVLPQIFGFAIVVGGFIIFGTLQYLLWGHWFRREPVDDDNEVPRDKTSL